MVERKRRKVKMALTWIGKTVGKVPSKNEVSVTLNKNGENKFMTAFRFRNNAHLRITKTGFIEYALTSNRIYFRESTERIGYSVTSKSTDGKNVSIKTNRLNDKFIGDYDLLWDGEEKLNYIDVTKRILEKR
jgi:flagellar hook assembly protein FlgD